VDYPPGYLYVLWLCGKLSAAPGYLLLKLPAFAADLGLAWVAGTLAARLAPASLTARLPVRTLVAVAVLFSPAVIGLSAAWGQVDSVPALLAVSALLLVLTGSATFSRELAGFLCLAAAAAMKPQAAFVLPVLLYALYRRHLHGRPRPELVDGLLRVAVVGALALSLLAVSGLAFGLGPVSLFRFYQHAASVYPVTSANAFNLWGAIGAWRDDTGGAALLGMLAFLAAVALVLRRSHRALERGADESRMLVAAAGVVALLAFLLLTRMHERYLFLALACLAPIAFARPVRLPYAALCGLFLVNLWYPYAYFNAQWGVEDFRIEPVFGAVFGGFATDAWQKTAWSLAVVAVGLLLVRGALRWAAEGAAEEARSPAGPEERLRDGGRWPAVLVALACALGLVFLHPQTAAPQNLNDSAFHLQMVRWAHEEIGEGRVPLDGWYPNLTLGSSFFHHYQSLPETITAYVAHATGSSPRTAYLWILYLLLALWPVAIYAAGRLFELGKWPAAAAAAAAPLLVSAPGYGYEHATYTWAGYGVYSQLWAMWLLPLSWGLAWQAVAHGRRYAQAVAALAFTIACHFITAYLALLVLPVWVLVLGGAGIGRRIGRAALLAGGSLVVASWVLVPLLADIPWTTRSAYYAGTFYADSFGARTVLGWLAGGGLFDSGRLPVVTALVLLGAGVCVARARTDVRARALLGAFGLSLLLFFGRPTLGPVLDLIPGFGDVQIHRFVMGVHLAGILIAGVGLAWALGSVAPLARRVAPARLAAAGGLAAVGLAVALLAPAWTERISYDRHDAALAREQRAADATDGQDLDRLVAVAKAGGGGRVYAGLRAGWGRRYTVGHVPVYAWLAERDADAVGFTFRTIASLSTDVEAAFDETNPAQYEQLGIRYLLMPADRRPPVEAQLLAESGRHRLYSVETSGYLDVVDRTTAIAANRTDLERATRAWRTSSLALRGVYPGVAFAGEPGPPPTFAGPEPPPGRAGKVVALRERPADGVFGATVEAARPAVALLKASYDPRWSVTVDGRPADPVMMAPSLVGVDVPPGRHTVEFRYVPYRGYPLLLALGALTLLGLVLAPRRAALATLLGRAADGTAVGPQLARFATVGVTNTLLSYAVYALLLAVALPYPLAGAVGFAAGAVNGYVLNRRWTFGAPDSGRARARYLVVALGGLAATSFLLALLVSTGGLGRLPAYALTIPLVTLGTFAAARVWTFALPHRA
jgi:Gpi18-like mannosyltransferase/putative flippase GtrA